MSLWNLAKCIVSFKVVQIYLKQKWKFSTTKKLFRSKKGQSFSETYMTKLKKFHHSVYHMTIYSNSTFHHHFENTLRLGLEHMGPAWETCALTTRALLLPPLCIFFKIIHKALGSLPIIERDLFEQDSIKKSTNFNQQGILLHYAPQKRSARGVISLIRY